MVFLEAVKEKLISTVNTHTGRREHNPAQMLILVYSGPETANFSMNYQHRGKTTKCFVGGGGNKDCKLQRAAGEL